VRSHSIDRTAGNLSCCPAASAPAGVCATTRIPSKDALSSLGWRADEGGGTLASRTGGGADGKKEDIRMEAASSRATVRSARLFPDELETALKPLETGISLNHV
jgi:hypothetical protein